MNVGCRDAEVCNLRWDWEVAVPELETSVFILPERIVENGQERLVILNRTTMSVIDSSGETIQPTCSATTANRSFV